jgi:PAS domain S-box-containing protein
MFELVHEDDVQLIARVFSELLDGQASSIQVEVRVRHKDGSWRVLEAIGHSLLDNPAVSGIVGNFHDITERKLTEEQLRIKENAVDNSISAIAMSDMGGRITYVNRACTELWGSEAGEDLLGKPYWKLLEMDSIDTANEVATAMLEKGSWEGEVVARTKDGRVRYVHVASGLVKDDQGNPIQTISSFIDITERRLAEQALRESEQEYSLLVGNLADAVFRYREGKIAWCNERIGQMLGYTVEELIEKDVNIFFSDDTGFSDVYREANAGLKELSHFHGTTRVKRKDGSVADIEFTASLVPGKDPFEIVGIARDVTEQKQMEQQLQLSGRLASVGQLAAGVAHELNNPLAAVQAYAQFLASSGDLDQAMRTDVETIYKEAQRASRITANLLQFARKHEPEKMLISINTVVQESVELHAYRMRVNNVELLTDLDPDLPETMADFHQLQQVFVNLITNAEQAMTEARGQGKLTIKSQRVKRGIRVTFTDDGPGIPADNLNNIFDPFFTTKEVGKGTGLGLSICYGIVEQHGGTMRATSKVGKGTTFVVEIPVVSEDQATDDQVDSVDNRSRQTRPT